MCQGAEICKLSVISMARVLDTPRTNNRFLRSTATILASELRVIVETGAGDRDRTGDIQLGKLAFYR
jgi:hypothetical protein